jgi:hypothetical protein
LLTHFGGQVRKERKARGWSIYELSKRTKLSAGYISQIENGERPPTERVAEVMDEVFPERRGWFTEFYLETRDFMPPGLRNWREYESKAVRLSVWCPCTVHGLFQTESYARTMIALAPVSDEIIARRLTNRMERQGALYRTDPPPPSVTCIVDEAALARRVGSAEIMAAQMRRLLEVASMPHVVLVVLPAIEHPATASELIIADNSAAYCEHLAEGGVYTDETVTGLDRLMSRILSESYRASESAAIIERAEERWTSESRATAEQTDRASKSRRATV